MAVNLQPTYNVTQPIALPGMPATEHGWDGDSYIVDKTLAAPNKIPFGVACSPEGRHRRAHPWCWAAPPPCSVASATATSRSRRAPPRATPQARTSR